MSRVRAPAAQNEPALLRNDRKEIAWLTLNRPTARNALSSELMASLQAELDGIAGNRSIKVVVIAGAGPAFCAGHDLREMRRNPGRAAAQSFFEQCSRLMQSITKLPQPVIARVH